MIDVIIVGAGTAGLTAALYANRAGLKVLVIEKLMFGGQITNTPIIENYPALPNVSGFDFVQSLYKQAITDFKTPIVYEEIKECDLDSDIKKITTNKNVYESKTVIIAAGAEHRMLGCTGEKEYKGMGVSYCATCDGAFFRGKSVCVVGGGNTALQDAKYLSNHCEKVYLIHRRDSFRATKIEVESALKRENIIPIYDSVVEEIYGEKGQVKGVKIKNTKTSSVDDINLDGVFVAVGLSPSSDKFDVLCDESGYIVAGEDCKTNKKGVFVAGDIRTKKVRQLVTAAADGAVSAENALEYINK